MKKRVLSAFLVLCMALLLLPAGALADDEAPDMAKAEAETALLPETELEPEDIALPAAEALFPEEDIENAPTSGTCGKNLTWSLDVESGVLTISGTGAMEDYGIASSAPWRRLAVYIKSVVIQSDVTSIGDEAFCDCQNITAVSIPDSVTTIGNGAFCFCHALESVAIPSGVISIGDSAFAVCAALESVVIPSGVTSIGEYTFSRCHNLKSITIPDSVTAIGPAAFEGCDSLNNVTLPESITTIEYNAFCGCSSLDNITLPSGITEIPHALFSICTSLKSISIPDSVTSIDSGAFANCTALESIIIPDSVTSIGSRAFDGCKKLTSVILPEGVTSIADGLFAYCTSLVELGCSDELNVIGKEAFAGCTSLETFFIPDAVTTIEPYTFWGCTSLLSVLIPGSVTSVGDNAFWGCTSLEVVLYTGTEDDLERMDISEIGNEPLQKAKFQRFYTESPFTDVVYSEDNWYYEPVLWALNTGITAGTSETTFSPNNFCTRAQAVAFLWRAAGEPEPESTTMPFTDVKSGDYYYDAVLWAVESGITAGTTATTFSPNKSCTRGQIISFLYRFENYGKTEAPALNADTAFTDLNESTYYYTPVLWAAQEGIVAGITDTTFGPNRYCTRAQIVTFLYRYALLSLDV